MNILLSQTFSTSDDLCSYANQSNCVIVQIVATSSGQFILFYRDP
jgi:hypothetical protein